jgi:hypothetical protein
MDRHPVDGWVGEYDEQTLEQALRLKAELNEKVELQVVLGSQLAESERVKEALERSQMELKAIRASTSWRLTAPLRLGGTVLRALRSFRRDQ